MKSNLCPAYLAASVIATEAILTETPAGQDGGLTLHEWGTFSSVALEDGSAIDWVVLSGKDELPS
jgi:hypothetical protein